MIDREKLPAASQYSIHRFGFRTRQVETIVSCLTTPTLLATNNPDRLHLLMVLKGSNRVAVLGKPAVTDVNGVPMPTQFDAIAWTPENDGEATGYERWGIAQTASTDVLVIETIRVVIRKGGRE